MWLSKNDLMELGFQKRTINHYISSGRWESRVTGETGARGEEVREVALRSLSSKKQTQWLEIDRARPVIRSASGAPSGAPPTGRALESGAPQSNADVIDISSFDRAQKADDAIGRARSSGAPRNLNPARHIADQPGAPGTWLTMGELESLGIPRQTLRRRVKSTEWTSRIGVACGEKNGTPMREVLLESLPNDLQVKYFQLQRTEALGFSDDDSVTDDPEITQDDTGFQDGDAERLLIEALKRYTPDAREAFLVEAQRLASIVERYEAILPKRVRDADGKHKFVPTVIALCEEARCTDEVVLQIEPSRAKSRSPHTLDLWLKAYRDTGLAAFLRKPQEQSGPVDKRKAKVSAPAIEWVNQVWRNYSSPRHLHRALKKKAKREGWVIPAESWIRRRFKSLPKIVSTVVYQGEKAYTGKYSPFVPRDFRDLEALQILCGDHSVRDVTVMLPDGQLTRPWLTTWYDMRTGLIWGWHLDLTPSSNTIGLAYVNGVQNFGAQPISNPEAGFYSYLYTDQGKDYRCKTLTGQTLVFKNAARIEGGMKALCTQRKVGFFEEMNLKHILARGYNAREKPVERVHRVISDWEENTFENEYCGRDAKNKPDAWVRAWHRHARLLKKFNGNTEMLQADSPFMAIDDYREALAGFVNEYNNSEHTRAVLGGSKAIPIEEYQRLYTTRYEISDEALALFLMKADRKKIGKNGVQMFQAHWYFLNEAMSEFKGEQVEVRWSDGDYSRIWVVLPNGSVVEASLITPSSILQPNKKTMETVKKQQAHERKVIREFQFIQQSNYRGETTEDRVAQLINPDDMPPEAQKIAVNAGPTIHAMSRFDKPKLAGPSRPAVSAEQIENANVIEGMFGGDAKRPQIKEEWED